MYKFKISEHLQDILKKLGKRDKLLHERVLAKMDEVINSYDVEHYKNLKYNMKDSKRVHVGSFVLIFQFDKNNSEINFDDFDHHDVIYNR
ncbi:TPA: addiction module toxin RelE [Candidatus Woesearchaeota archaeon]|nr:addiction module toxin RelE [Candidatus Woesearchaeota archaeon]